MSLSSQFYTGADPLPVREPGRKAGRRFSRGLAGPAVVTVILSIGLTVGVMRIVWSGFDASPAPPEVRVQNTVHPPVQIDVPTHPAREWPAWPVSGVRGQKAERTEKSAKAQKTTEQPAPTQQLPRIIVDVPALPPPFPTEESIKVGTPRAHLIQAFGKPDLRARTLQKKRLIETYVYEQPERATIVRMQDGSVVSASTGQPARIRLLASESDSEP